MPKFVLFFSLTALSVYLAKHFLGDLNYWKILLVSPAIYFSTEAMGALGQLLFPFKNSWPIHADPLKSRDLGNFWGRRWNLWIQDWLRDITGAFKSNSRSQTILLGFLFSGLFHELMCNLPYWLIYRKSYFGTMMAYFLIQGLALWIDKKYIKVSSPFLRRIYCWCAVVIPSPLFINVPLLTFLGLKHV
ncbi:MBOAT family protein [Peredibacter starrii]|uniref:MBOAT family protein n=1 Tax=Peredibacter starrii TaxID=28202 RepID=A0AAX4HS25_9BACT|nr:MBOAT family protein [Peredibacter starrii]WPU66026.1 MBOAT family protein [Peredibacter starrii]